MKTSTTLQFKTVDQEDEGPGHEIRLPANQEDLNEELDMKSDCS